MNELDSLIIYKQYTELIYYTNMILKKFPKIERYSLATEIKTATFLGMESIIWCHKMYEKNKKLQYLNELDVKLKFLKVLIRVSHKNRYISSNNYAAWSKKIANICNLLGGWINSCLKQ